MELVFIGSQLQKDYISQLESSEMFLRHIAEDEKDPAKREGLWKEHQECWSQLSRARRYQVSTK